MPIFFREDLPYFVNFALFYAYNLVFIGVGIDDFELHWHQ